MPANVETMMYNRQAGVPWHGLGTPVEGAVDSEEALVKAGLLWAVEKRPLYLETGQAVPGFAATVRTTDQRILGVVSDRYEVIQNRQAFAFTDLLLGEGVRYETAGSLRGGRRVWILARLPEPFRVAGDDTDLYLCFTNSHDGTNAVKALVTPVRVVCQNTLNLAIVGARRSWSAVHVGDLENRSAVAREVLGLGYGYMEALDREADRLANRRIDLEEYVAQLLPYPEGAGAVAAANVEERRADILRRAEVEDLKPFTGTGWAFVNAVADHVGHAEPKRRTATFGERRFERIVDGQTLLQSAYSLVTGAD